MELVLSQDADKVKSGAELVLKLFKIQSSKLDQPVLNFES
jgi:hypothetical protein